MTVWRGCSVAIAVVSAAVRRGPKQSSAGAIANACLCRKSRPGKSSGGLCLPSIPSVRDHKLLDTAVEQNGRQLGDP
jgi:hypothetical protein